MDFPQKFIIDYGGLYETAFGFLQPKTVLLQPSKYFLKILQMFLVRCPGYQDVVKV